DSSKIVAIKGIGGFHIACSTQNDEVVLRLRKNLKRPEQPFAIISKDKESVGEFAELSMEEEELLESWRRPIVILKKKKDFFLSKYLAPNLSTIGVMLPYTPLHHLLFHYSKSKSFVMTSANKPSYPMVVENEAAFQELKFVDYYLIHNLKIVNRTDDSVIKFIKKKPVFVRRSRGYVPQYLEANHEKNVLALGAELTNTFCITKNRKAIPSQYIGNTYNFDCLEFQKKAISHFKRILKIKDFDYVFCDYHPEYNTTKLALEFENVFKVQHHFAHGFSLGKDLVVIACDGMGYGVDSKIWGGEILYVGDEFARLGHLENQVLAGGDVSTHYPARLSLAILKKVFKNPIEEMERYEKYFRYGKEEMRIVLEQIEKKVNVTETSSCGRILDSASSILEICNFRSYEGEPAMKLEAIASGKEIELPLEIFEVNELKYITPYVEYKKKIKGKRGRLQILKTTPIVREIFERYRKGERKKILAKSILACIAKGLAQIAIEGAREYETKRIGFRGGCALNSVMTEVIKREVEREGFEFLQQENVPPGDGGISYGQVKFAKFLG
ncbi:MAG: carbamoyltransferase HypF, partial [Candidatus Methanofastidiosia archaeon]